MSLPSTQDFTATLSGYLNDIEESLVAEAVASNPFTTEASRHVIAAGGKRFRPALVVTAALCNPEVAQAHLEGTDQAPGDGLSLRQRIIHGALVMELTHVASLYHDDVMDEATLRRGVPSANAAYGNSIAIMVGDFLFAQASRLVATLGQEYVDLQARTFAELVQGQIAETIGPAEGADPLQHYLDVVDGKTASLIRASALFGGMIAGLSGDHLKALGDFGHEIGMVFQLSDDLIDIISDETGKTPGTDLREGVPTLPTLMMRSSDDPDDRAFLARLDAGLTSDDDVADALAHLRAHPIIDEARRTIDERAEAARALLDPLPDTEAKAHLAMLCDEVVRRTS